MRKSQESVLQFVLQFIRKNSAKKVKNSENSKINLNNKKSLETRIKLDFQDFSLAGVQGLEPWARGFGDRCSTN